MTNADVLRKFCLIQSTSSRETPGLEKAIRILQFLEANDNVSLLRELLGSPRVVRGLNSENTEIRFSRECYDYTLTLDGGPWVLHGGRERTFLDRGDFYALAKNAMTHHLQAESHWLNLGI